LLFSEKLFAFFSPYLISLSSCCEIRLL